MDDRRDVPAAEGTRGIATVTVLLLVMVVAVSGAAIPQWFPECLSTHTRSCNDSSKERFEWNCSVVANSYPTCMHIDDIKTPYVVPTQDPIQFATHPQDALLYGESPIVLKCSVTGLTCLTPGSCPQYLWRRGDKDLLSDSLVTNTASGSILRFNSSDASLAGEYTCVVSSQTNTGDLFTVVSFPATVRTPLSTNLFFNWSHEVSKDLVTNKTFDSILTVDMAVPEGTNVILDCTVVSPVPSECHVWSIPLTNSKSSISLSICQGHVKNKTIKALPSGNLAVYNFSRELEGTYVCVLNRDAGIQQIKKYKLSTTAGSRDLRFVAYPQSQTVVKGSNVTLYCTATGSTPPLIYKWYKDGKLISPQEMPYGPSVLFLKQVNIKDAAAYSCTVASANGVFVNRTAYLKVLAPIKSASISVLHSSFKLVNLSNGDILLPPKLTTGNFTLQCSLPFNQDDPQLTFSWLFRGQKVGQSTSSLYSVNGGELHVVVTEQDSVESVFGSIQCLVRGVAGRASVTVRILENGKPNPPGPILAQKTQPGIEYNYRYRFDWADSNSTFPVSGYQMEIFIQGTSAQSSAVHCSVGVASSCLVYDGICNIMLAKTYDADPDVFVRVAAVGDTVISDYSVFNGGSSETVHCKVFKEFIPPVLHLHEMLIADETNREYSGTLSWEQLYESYNTSFTKEDEKMLTYDYKIDLTCDDKTVIHTTFFDGTVLDNNHTIIRPPLSCAMECSWYVTVSTGDDDDGTKSAQRQFTTPPFSPNVSGTLKSLEWTDHSGSSFDITWIPPSKDLKASSCIAADTHVYNLTILYQHDDNQYTTNMTANFTDMVHPLHIPLNNSDDCWSPFTVSVSFSNSAGLGPAGNKMALPSPQPSNITGFSSVSYNVKTAQLSWTLDAGMQCFIGNYRYIYYYDVSVLVPRLNSSLTCSIIEDSEWTNASFTKRLYASESHNTEDLHLPSSVSKLCLQVTFIGKHDQVLLKQQTNLKVVGSSSGTASPPTKPPSQGTNSTAHTTSSSTPTHQSQLPGGIEQPLLIGLVVMVVVTVAVAAICVLVYFLWKCRKCFKPSQIEERLIPEGSVFIPKDNPLMSDKQSEHTTCNYILERYLDDAMSHSTELDDSVSTVSNEVELSAAHKIELNKGFAGTSKSAEMDGVELHELAAPKEEREIDEQTGKKIMAQNLESASKPSWNRQPKKKGSRTAAHPHTTINLAPVTHEGVKRVADILLKQGNMSTGTSVESEYLLGCIPVEQTRPLSQVQLGSECLVEKMTTFDYTNQAPSSPIETEQAAAALSHVMACTPHKPHWQTTSPSPSLSTRTESASCASELSPARSAYLSIDSPELQVKHVPEYQLSPLHKSTSPPSSSLTSQQPSLTPCLAPLQLQPMDDYLPQSEIDSAHLFTAVSTGQDQRAVADGYITEENLSHYGAAGLSSPLHTQLRPDSLVGITINYTPLSPTEREQQAAANGYVTEQSLIKPTLTASSMQEHYVRRNTQIPGSGYMAEQRRSSSTNTAQSKISTSSVSGGSHVTSDGYLTEQSLGNHSVSSQTPRMMPSTSSVHSLPHSHSSCVTSTSDSASPLSSEQAEVLRPSSAADSAMMSVSPPEPLSQASSVLSVFSESETEPSSPAHHPPFLPPLPLSSQRLARLHSDCSSGIFSSPTSPGARTTAGYFRSESLSSYLPPSSSSDTVTAAAKLLERRAQPVANQLATPTNMSSKPSHSQSRASIGSMGTGLDYSTLGTRRLSTPVNYLSSLAETTGHRQPSSGLTALFPTSSSSLSYSGAPFASAPSTNTQTRTGTTRHKSLSSAHTSPSRHASLSSAQTSTTRHASLSSAHTTRLQSLPSDAALPGSSCSTTPTTSSHGPSFLAYMYAKSDVTSATTRTKSNQTITSVKPQVSRQQGVTFERGSYVDEKKGVTNSETVFKKRDMGARSSSHESLSSFDSSYSPSSSLEDLPNCADNSSLSPSQSSYLPPPVSSCLSPLAPSSAGNDYTNTDDLWDHHMILTMEELKHHMHQSN